jgi:transcription elongation factor Elf1
MTCPACGYQFQIAPSICMQFGVNAGHATCLGCQLFLHVEAVTSTEAKGELWDDYVSRQSKEPEPNSYVHCPEGGAA